MSGLTRGVGLEGTALVGGFEGDDWWASGCVAPAPRASSAPNGSPPAARVTPNTQSAVTASRAAMAIRRRPTKGDPFFIEEEIDSSPLRLLVQRVARRRAPGYDAHAVWSRNLLPRAPVPRGAAR